MHFQNRRSNRAIIARRYFRLVEQAQIDLIPAKPTMNPAASQVFWGGSKKPPTRALQETTSDLWLYKTVTCRGCVAATYITTCVYVCACKYISVCICICIYVCRFFEYMPRLSAIYSMEYSPILFNCNDCSIDSGVCVCLCNNLNIIIHIHTSHVSLAIKSSAHAPI